MTGLNHRAGLRHEAFVFDDDEFVGRTVAHLLKGMEEEEARSPSSRAPTGRPYAIRSAGMLRRCSSSIATPNTCARRERPRATTPWCARPRRSGGARCAWWPRCPRARPPPKALSGRPMRRSSTWRWRTFRSRSSASTPSASYPTALSTRCGRRTPGASPTVARPTRTTSTRPASSLPRLATCRDSSRSPSTATSAPFASGAAAMIARSVPQVGVINMLVARTEIVNNANEHGGGASEGRVGMVAGRFVCEIADQGPGLADPMAGYYPPHSGRSPGDGLWVARQLVHLLQVVLSAPGTTVRSASPPTARSGTTSRFSGPSWDRTPTSPSRTWSGPSSASPPRYLSRTGSTSSATPTRCTSTARGSCATDARGRSRVICYLMLAMPQHRPIHDPPNGGYGRRTRRADRRPMEAAPVRFLGAHARSGNDWA